jgi:hypothetical protein
MNGFIRLLAVPLVCWSFGCAVAHAYPTEDTPTERSGGGMITYAEQCLRARMSIDRQHLALVKRNQWDVGTTYTQDEAARINSACAEFPQLQIITK